MAKWSLVREFSWLGPYSLIHPSERFEVGRVRRLIAKGEGRVIDACEAIAWVRILDARDKFARYESPLKSFLKIEEHLEAILAMNGVDPSLPIISDPSPQSIHLAADALRTIGAARGLVQDGRTSKRNRGMETAIRFGMHLQHIGELLQRPNVVLGTKNESALAKARPKSTKARKDQSDNRKQRVISTALQIRKENPTIKNRKLAYAVLTKRPDIGIGFERVRQILADVFPAG